MNEPKTIVLTTDFSATSCKAIQPAVMLARKYGAKVLLVHIRDLIPMVMVEYPTIDLTGIEEAQRAQVLRELSQFRDKHLPSDLEVENVVTLGIPHVEILRVAAERGADLIVMATHGRGFISHLVLGSTTERVLRGASCPVLVLRDPSANEK